MTGLAGVKDGPLRHRRRRQMSAIEIKTRRVFGPSLSLRRRGELYAVLAAVVWSSAGILQRQLSVGAATQVAGRGTFAFLALAAYVAVLRHRRGRASIGRGGLILAVCMSVASACFMLALNHTSVAHVLFFQALSPLVAALLAAKLIGERPDLRTLMAMLLAVAGVIVMVGGPGGGNELGNGLALLTAVAFAVIIVVSRWHRDISMPSAICLSQLFVVLAFAPFAGTAHLGLANVGWLAAFGIGQIALGTMLFALAARSVPAAELALIFLLEVVLGPLWTWIGLGEQLSAATLVGGSVVLAAVVLQIGARRDREEQGLVSPPAVRRNR
jgi:drug/metabolite transporter (DMT)-like permease